ncbi:uncharacterized protein VDAG_06699 [Verticillium dahliae VdLs.17]|uniref:Uncharacterized protein n=1 Tax=Verticillium dahliae (strain VdLs.17 / ATCC MYA-4575 / FGSC 10137) TaxID=498257 RepID=G2X967_VERDV|nr:uncharacterized protein VDAG_06699 [Verticillium dahliae VdLs.17]EGY15535.1 hypothetical protein VDAG_06699 [Verticillium dahliae VdLs.17]KAH6687606.1 hypothetical protein EV126DRAFT_446007 [Verticillium dahliae]
MNSRCPLTCQTDAVWLINAVIVPGEQAEVEGMPASSGVFERWQGQCLREVVATGGPRVPGRQRQAVGAGVVLMMCEQPINSPASWQPQAHVKEEAFFADGVGLALQDAGRMAARRAAWIWCNGVKR